jgi:hypothetical protein
LKFLTNHAGHYTCSSSSSGVLSPPLAAAATLTTTACSPAIANKAQDWPWHR